MIKELEIAEERLKQQTKNIIKSNRYSGNRIKNEKLYNYVKDFIESQEIDCPEMIYQSDSVIEGAYEFIEGCANIIGYCKYNEEKDIMLGINNQII
jgi:hypothetical protein